MTGWLRARPLRGLLRRVVAHAADALKREPGVDEVRLHALGQRLVAQVLNDAERDARLEAGVHREVTLRLSVLA